MKSAWWVLKDLCLVLFPILFSPINVVEERKGDGKVEDEGGSDEGDNLLYPVSNSGDEFRCKKLTLKPVKHDK